MLLKKWGLLALSSLMLGSSAFANIADDVKDLDDRVFEIENMLKGKKAVLPYDAELLQVGGVVQYSHNYVNSEEWKTGEGEAMEENTRADLFIGGNINDDLSFLVVPTWVHATDAKDDSADRDGDGRADFLILYRAYGDYKLHQNLTFRFGRFVTPVGIYLDTYSPNSDTIGFPQFLDKSVAGGVLFNPVLDGMDLFGKARIGSMRVGYHLYGGVQSISQAEFANSSSFGQELADGNPEEVVVGARLQAGMGPVDFGMSFQQGHRGRSFKAYGADLKVSLGKFKLKSEWQLTSEGHVQDESSKAELVNYATCYTAGTAATCDLVRQQNAGVFPTGVSASAGDARVLSATLSRLDKYLETRQDSHKTSWYVEPTYQLTEKILLAARYDYFNGHSVLFDNGDSKSIYSVGINYMPVPQLRLRILAEKHDFKSSAGGGAFKGNNTLIGTLATLNGKSSADGQLAAAANPDFMVYGISATLSF